MRRIGALFGFLHIHRIEINICANAIYSAIKYCVISRDNSPCDDHKSPTRARGGLRENPTTWEAHPHPLVPPKLQTRATRRLALLPRNSLHIRFTLDDDQQQVTRKTRTGTKTFLCLVLINYRGISPESTPLIIIILLFPPV